jgi:hypothetical protein
MLDNLRNFPETINRRDLTPVFERGVYRCSRRSSPFMAVDGRDQQSKIRIEPTAPIRRTKQAAREIDGQHVEVLVMGYTDRITINVMAEGKLGQLV